ncbi:MAG: hypothetical protein MAG431_00880 [Chloroflexi bacterium]|nr:hypothetical protein [Chloroflexota bacterium]
MQPFQKIDSFGPIKTVADPLRLKILRLLMAESATLSQLGRTLNLHPAKVRYHLKQLEEIDLVELVSKREVGGFVEKYYRATSRALMVNLVITPQTERREPIIAMGSHDLALDLLAQTLSQNQSAPEMFTVPVGSLDGLLALRQGMCQMAGCHLFNPQSGEYNLSYVRHIFPDQDIQVVTLARRQQGMVVAPGNPHQLQALDDLAQTGIRFINRKKGSGTRLWLDQQLRQKKIPAEKIPGYDWTVNTHLDVAQAVAEGRADAGIAVLAAVQGRELDFIPLFEERYDLVIPAETYQNPLLAPTLDALHAGDFRRTVEGLGGYDTGETGREIPLHDMAVSPD